MPNTPDWDALLTNLANAATTYRDAGKAVNPPLPIENITEEARDAYTDAENDLEEIIFNYLAASCYLEDEIPALYLAACHRIRRLGFQTTPI